MTNEVVVITGASAGLGRATAREFGRHGAKVGLIDRCIDGLEAAKREIESAGGNATVLRLDVADASTAAAIELVYRSIPLQSADCAAKHANAGFTTVEAIVGNELAPGLLDRYLGKTGFDSQQTSEPVDRNRPNNLWESVNGDHGAHGAFDRQANDTSWELRANLDRRWIGTGLAAIVAAGLLAARRA